MAEKTSYLSYEGLQTLVKQIKAKFALDASLKLTDTSLANHIEDTTKHITTAERDKWNGAVTTAGNAVTKTDYDAKVKEIDGSISAIKTDKANKATTLKGYGIADAYTKAEVDASISALGSVLNFKGTTDTSTLLPTTGNKQGDVWHVKANSAEYVWVQEDDAFKWEELGSTISLADYATKQDVEDKFGDANATFAGTAAKAINAETAANALKLNGVVAAEYAKLTDITLKGVKVNGAALIATDKVVDVTVATGTANGTIAVNGRDVAVKGLGSAAYTESTDYATAVQGAKADSALQRADLDASLADYAKTADVTKTYATKAELKTLNDASTSYEKSANKVDDISVVGEEEVSVKYPSVKAVKAAIEAGISAGDTRVKQSEITTGESPILMAGAETSGASAEAKYAAGVTINAATSTLTAEIFAGNLTGTAAKATNADKAVDSDQLGGVAAAKYATKDDLTAQMVTPISTTDVEALFN